MVEKTNIPAEPPDDREQHFALQPGAVQMDDEPALTEEEMIAQGHMPWRFVPLPEFEP